MTDLPDPSISAFGRPRPFKRAWISRRKVEPEVQQPSRLFVDGDCVSGWYVRREGFGAHGWMWYPSAPFKAEFFVHALSGLYLTP